MKSQKHQTKLISTTENCFLRKGFLVVDFMSYFCRFKVFVYVFVNEYITHKVQKPMKPLQSSVWIASSLGILCGFKINFLYIKFVCMCVIVCMDMSLDIQTHCNVASLKCILNFSLLKIIYLFILCEAGFWLLTLSDASNTQLPQYPQNAYISFH